MNDHLLYVAVEGDLDETVVRRVLKTQRASPIAVYGKAGKDQLTLKIPAYNSAARFWPWLVVRDLNHDALCAPALVAQLLPFPAQKICFRVAKHEIESWLLRRIREDMVPRPGSGRSVGPAYNSRLNEFAQASWRPEAAEQNSPSSRKCILRLQQLLERE